MQLPRLAEWRLRRALALRDLAASAGIGLTTINRIERGHQAARPSTARKLAEALGVEPAALMEPSGGQPETTEATTEDRRS